MFETLNGRSLLSFMTKSIEDKLVRFSGNTLNRAEMPANEDRRESQTSVNDYSRVATRIPPSRPST